MNPSESVRYLTPAEAAEIFRVSKRSITRLCLEGSLYAIKVGKQWRIPAREMEKEAPRACTTVGRLGLR